MLILMILGCTMVFTGFVIFVVTTIIFVKNASKKTADKLTRHLRSILIR